MRYESAFTSQSFTNLESCVRDILGTYRLTRTGQRDCRVPKRVPQTSLDSRDGVSLDRENSTKDPSPPLRE